MWTLWESRVLCVHKGGSVHIVFYDAKKFNMIEASATARRSPDVEVQGDPEVDRGHDRRSWGILSGLFLAPARVIWRIMRIARSSSRTALVAQTRPD